MTDRQINRLMMFRAVSDYLTANEADIAKIDALAELAAELKERISALEFASEKHTTLTKGRTDTKYEAEDILSDILKVVSSALYAYAHKTGNNETKAVASMREWKFRTLRDEEQLRHATVILREATAVAADIERFGVTAEVLETFRRAVANYEQSMLVRDGSVSERIVTTADIRVMFKELGVLIAEQLDPMMRTLRSIAPRVYDGYKAVRVTRSLGIRYRKNGEAAPESVNDAGAEIKASGE